MASSKSRKNKRRHVRKRKQKQVKRLRSKLKQGSFRGEKIVNGSNGEVKMSEVLIHFVEPYRESAKTGEDYRKLLTIAIIAWNASFLPKEEQQDRVNRLFEQAIPKAPKELQVEFKEIVSMLITRKKRHFSEYRRVIINFELTDTGRELHLSVASTIEKTSPK